MRHEKDKRGGREEVYGKRIREIIKTEEGRELTNVAIAEMLGCDRTTVAYHRRKAGVMNPARRNREKSEHYRPPIVPGEGYPDEEGDWQAQPIPPQGGQSGLKDPTKQRIERMKEIFFQQHVEKKKEEPWEEEECDTK